MPRRTGKGRSVRTRRRHAATRGTKMRRVPNSARILGRNLRRICKAQDISTPQFAALIQKNTGTAEALLGGQRNLDLRELVSIARLLRVRVADLVRGL
jgi:hypothetical protein